LTNPEKNILITHAGDMNRVAGGRLAFCRYM
jgi:hypothetical protein